MLNATKLVFLTKYVEWTIKIGHLPPSVIIPHGPIQFPGLLEVHLHQKKLKILFLGRIGKYKGLELLIEAVSFLKNDAWECLTIAGKPLYKIEIPEHSKIKSVEKWLTEQEICHLVNHHDVLILPYRTATQSGVAALGIAATIPMVCTNVGGLKEQLGADEAVWTDANPISIAIAIQSLSNCPALYNEIHHRLLKKKSNLSWSKIASQLHDIIVACT
jgi:glycosyltransferase involved in cell wall biosynthesis